MKTKTLKMIVLLAFAAVLAVTLVMIPVGSYIGYRSGIEIGPGDGNDPIVKPPAARPKAVSLEAKLKEGVSYYDNNLARVTGDDLVVTAFYDDESSAALTADDYAIVTPSDFAINGGKVKITYGGLSSEIEIALLTVEISDLEVLSEPYTVVYRTGAVFDTVGMTVAARYNDGSAKILDKEEYTLSADGALTKDTDKVTVSYTEDEQTVSAEIDVTVSDAFEDGPIVSIATAGENIVYASEALSAARFTLLARYESGNRKVVAASGYTVDAADEKAELGKAYAIKVALTGDPEKKLTVPLTVASVLEGEDGTIVGGKKTVEPEYVFENGAFAVTGKNVGFAGSFAYAVKNGNESSLTFNVKSNTDCLYDATLRCGNSYIVEGADDLYYMRPLQINTILDLTVNGEPFAISNGVVLKGCGPSDPEKTGSAAYAPLYGVYYEFAFENMPLAAGVNEIKLTFKNSTEGAKTCWNESPSTMNIDKITLSTAGNEIPEDATVTGIEISKFFRLKYGVVAEETEVPVAGVLNNGTHVLLDRGDYTVKIVGDLRNGYVLNGNYRVTVALKADPTVTATAEYTVDEDNSCVAEHAYLENVADRIYYVIEGKNVGYTADNYYLFDKTVTYDATVVITGAEFRLSLDVTDFDEDDKQFLPHLKFDDGFGGYVNYVNGTNKNGDVYIDDVTSLKFGGKTYEIFTSYHMPAFRIK